MAARAVASTTISFGLVAIPTKLYTAAASEQVRFNMLQKETGARLRQQYVSAADGSVVERSETVKGYEYSRGQYVTFTAEELKALESAHSQHIEVVEFVPLEALDFVYVEKSYYVGPDKGGDRAYQLLSQCMRETQRVAVGQWAARGKEQLVLLRPYGRSGLILHQLYYANEVRKFDEIDPSATLSFSDAERELGRKLIEQLGSNVFDPSKYRDEYAARVVAAVERKVKGEELTVAHEHPRGQIIDLFEALKKSIETAPERPSAAETDVSSPRPPAKAKSRAEEVSPRPLKKTEPKRSRKRAANT